MRLAIATVALPLVTVFRTSSMSAQQAPSIPARDQQIVAAVLPLPTEWRATATVLGYGTDGMLTKLREGSGSMTCLASDPRRKDFHVACYHTSLEPFMARGRELRMRGVKDPEVDSVRFREARSGALKLPGGPASLYSITGGSFDPGSGTATEGRALFVV